MMINTGESHRGLNPPVHTPENEPRPFSKEGIQPAVESLLCPQKDSATATPNLIYRYRDVWLRAFFKIRAQSSVNSLGKEIHLFGANTMLPDHEADMTQAEAMVKKMRNQTYTMVEVTKDNPTVMKPSSGYRIIWSLIYLLLMIYTAFIMPYRLAFYEDSTMDAWFVLDNVVNALFFVDIVLTLNTAYYNHEGVLVTNRKAIWCNYLRGWLIIDVIACIPFNTFGSDNAGDSGGSNQVSGLLRLMRLPRLYRLLRLVRVFTAMKREQHSRLFEQFQETISLKHGSLRMIIFSLSFILALHLMSCLWYFVPTIEGMTPDTWVVQRNLQDSSISERYINSLYWAMTTLATVGYGDIVPGTIAEKIVAIIWMLFGVCFFSFVVSSLANVLNSMDSKRTVLMGKLAAMDEFSAESKLAKDLRFRLRHALRYSSAHTGFSSQIKRSIFNELPRALRYEVAMAMHHGAAKAIPFFSERDQAFVAAVVPFLNSLQVPEQEAVYNEGDYADEIYFISKGCCSIMCGEYPMKKLLRGAYFGEIELILVSQRKFTVQSTLKADLLSMNKKVLASIQDDFPVIYEEMKQIAEIRDKMNERARIKFLALFAGARRSIAKKPTNLKRESNTLIDNPEGKTVITVITPEQRLDAIEESVKDIQRMVRSMYDGQKEVGGRKGIDGNENGGEKGIEGIETRRSSKDTRFPGQILEEP